MYTKHNCVILQRALYILFVTVTVLPLLTGCLDFEFLAPKEPVTIQFAYFGGNTTYYEGLLEEFNKEYPHITIELTSERGYRGLETGEVDVFLGSQFQLRYLLENDGVISLNGLIAEDDDFDLNDFYPATVRALSTEGERWGIPLAVDMLMMHYNRDLFDQKNAPYPEVGWTWDDFLERATAINAPDAGVFGFAYHYMGSLGFYEPMVFVYQRGGRFFDNLEQPSRVILNEPRTVAAMQWYADLIHKHHVAPLPGERITPYPSRGIESGQYAMWIDWYSEQPDLNAGVAPLPSEQSAGTLAGVIGVFISSGAQSPEAAWAWASFLSQQTFGSLVPARQSLLESDAYRQQVGADVAQATRAAMDELVTMNFDLGQQLGQSWGQAMDALVTALSKIQMGEDPQAVLDEAQKKSGF